MKVTRKARRRASFKMDQATYFMSSVCGILTFAFLNLKDFEQVLGNIASFALLPITFLILKSSSRQYEQIYSVEQREKIKKSRVARKEISLARYRIVCFMLVVVTILSIVSSYYESINDPAAKIIHHVIYPMLNGMCVWGVETSFIRYERLIALDQNEETD